MPDKKIIYTPHFKNVFLCIRPKMASVYYPHNTAISCRLGQSSYHVIHLNGMLSCGVVVEIRDISLAFRMSIECIEHIWEGGLVVASDSVQHHFQTDIPIHKNHRSATTKKSLGPLSYASPHYSSLISPVPLLFFYFLQIILNGHPF